MAFQAQGNISMVNEIEKLLDGGKLQYKDGVVSCDKQQLLLVRDDKYYFVSHPDVEYIPRAERTKDDFAAMQEGEKVAIAFLCSRGAQKSAKPWLPNPPSHAWLSVYSPEEQTAIDFNFSPKSNSKLAEKSCNTLAYAKLDVGLDVKQIFNSQPTQTTFELRKRGTIQTAVGFPLTQAQELTLNMDDNIRG